MRGISTVASFFGSDMIVGEEEVGEPVIEFCDRVT